MAKMSSKKEDERNEKIIRGLLKLPPNRRCINCNSLGPQYVCTNFWTFVCISCSGIHREFTHRVKSVSMSKFTTQEVEALQKGGNQRARELFLIDWDTERMRLPCNSNPDKIREFIKNVYVEKKYAGGRSCDKPPMDTQTHKGTEDHRRASSYHSFSQSPPYDYQYEERRYGRQAGMLSRKPGSDRGQYEGKISIFIYSPDCQAEQMCEDRLARMSDYSISTTGDPFRSDGKSPKFYDSGYSSPYTQVRDSLAEDAGPQKLSTSMESNVKENQNRIPSAHRSASAGSFGSIDSNSISLKSADSGSLIDSVFEPEHASESHQAEASTFALSDMSSAAHTPSIDLFSQAHVQSQIASSASSIDLFADFTQQPSVLPASEQKLPAASFQRNDGWAAFDLPQHTLQLSEAKSPHSHSPFEANQGLPPMASVVEDIIKGNIDLYSSVHNSDWFPVQNSSKCGHPSVLDNQWSMDLSDLKGSADTSNLQEGSSQERKSTNPFDLPYDLGSAANNVFLDTSSLQAVLPDTQVPATFLSEFPDPWFPQNSLASFIPNVPQGGLSCIGGQVPSTQMQMQRQMQNIPSQGPVASVGGNPFA